MRPAEGEGVTVLPAGVDPEVARAEAARRWVATAQAAGERWGAAAYAMLTAYPALAAWYGHAAAEQALPSPW